jgi:chloramphenicol 3-O-phosphotransferase
LNANGENPKVIQELLRHATLKVTMDTYVQAMSDEKCKSAEQGCRDDYAWHSQKGRALMDAYWTRGETGICCK